MNEDSTLERLKSLTQQQRYGIIHLATHAEFQKGDRQNSYIQFWGGKLRLNQLWQFTQESGWGKNPKVEMLVLSACRTALRDTRAELGFAGLAFQAGVKTAIGSLWYASDTGALALMSEFYSQLKVAPTRSEALRQTQIAMSQGKVYVDGQLRLSNQQSFPLANEIAGNGVKLSHPYFWNEIAGNGVKLSHPYFWSAYTLVGNWN